MSRKVYHLNNRQYCLRVAIGFCLVLTGLSSGAQSLFQKHFSEITQYQRLSNSGFDNSYVIASSTRDKDGFYDFSVVKTDRSGKITWSKTFPSAGDDYLTSLAIASTGDILLGGYKLNSEGNFDFSLMRVDASGKLQWYKTYGTAGLDMCVFAGVTSSGDIYMSGNTEKDNGKSLWILKLNSAGAVLWSKMYSAEDVNAAGLTSDGGLLVMGSKYILKISLSGTIAFTNKVQFELLDMASLKQVSTGGFVYCGKIKYCTSVLCSNSFAFMRIDENGKVLWSSNFKGFGIGKDVIETADGGFAFVGQLNDILGDASTRLAIIKTDGNGKHAWTKAYGNADSYGEYACIEAATDGGFMLLGVEDSKALLIKTDAAGNADCNSATINPVFESMGLSSAATPLSEKNEPHTVSDPVCTEFSLVLTDSVLCSPTGMLEFSQADACSLFPNPFTVSATLEIKDKSLPLTGFEFTMYDVFGRRVMQLPVADHRLVISRSNLHGGMYFYEVRSGEQIIGSGKIIAQ